MKVYLDGLTVDDLVNLIKDVIRQEIQSTQTNKKSEFLTRKEAMDFIGCSSPSLINYQKQGLPYMRLGRKIMFDKNEVIEFLKSKNKKS